MKKIIKFAVILVIFSIPHIAPAKMEIGLGVQTWPFMWKGNKGISQVSSLSSIDKIKWAVSESNLDQLKILGASWNFVDVWQEQDGIDGFERIDRVIAEHERRGIAIVLRLLETPEIYDNLSAEATKYGYSRKYYDWIKRIADLFGSRVRAVMISNEADHNLGFNRISYKPFRKIHYSEYYKILQTAALAIKDSGSRVKFMNHGISSYSLCITILNDIYNKQGLDAALTFWRSMEYDLEQNKRTAFRLFKLLNTAESKRRIAFVEESTKKPAIYDYYQLHHYFGPASLGRVIQWVREKMRLTGAVKEIVAAEFGYRMPVKLGKTWDGTRTRNVADWPRFDENAQAIALVKSVAMFAQLDIHQILYWKIRFQNSRDSTGTLYEASEKADRFKPFKAAIGFEYLVKTLSNRDLLRKNLLPISLATDARLNVVSFAGNPNVSIVWSAGLKGDVKLVLPGAIMSITDVYGANINPSSDKTITLGDAPVYLYWVGK